LRAAVLSSITPTRKRHVVAATHFPFNEYLADSILI
jgi:hypothetical protein